MGLKVKGKYAWRIKLLYLSICSSSVFIAIDSIRERKFGFLFYYSVSMSFFSILLLYFYSKTIDIEISMSRFYIRKARFDVTSRIKVIEYKKNNIVRIKFNALYILIVKCSNQTQVDELKSMLDSIREQQAFN